MKKILIFTLFSCILFGCTAKIIRDKNINRIVLMDNQSESVLKEINRASEINSIVETLNSAEKHLIKFRATHKIEIYRGNSDKSTVLINGDNMKVDGVTYTLGINILNILEK